MPKSRKFAALAALHHQQAEVEAPQAPPEDEPMPRAGEVGEGKGRGRPPTGKRSNPEWKLYSHFLKRKTQRAAVARLQAEDDGRNLSDVLQELLENWLKT
jgi:hypothetical protein